MSEKAKNNLTPMMRQYYEIKNQHPDKYLFFRLGDFYEMFDQDALEVSALLQITLTERNQTPMCGIPYHQLHRYAHRIIRAGKKVVIVEQGEKNDHTPGLVERKITQIITPGTTLDEMNLTPQEKKFIVSIYLNQNEKGEPQLFQDEPGTAAGNSYIVGLETTTGEVIYEAVDASVAFLERALARFFENYSPSELVLKNTFKEPPWVELINKLQKQHHALIVNHLAIPTLEQINNKLTELYPDITKTAIKNSTYSAFTDFSQNNFYGVKECLYLLTTYVATNHNTSIDYLQIPKKISSQEYMVLDQQTLVQLEIFKNNYDHSSKYSLFSIINYTATPMGARTLQENLALPHLDLDIIRTRLAETEFFFNHPHFLLTIREQLKKVADVERITTRLALKKILPREFLQLKRSLIAANALLKLLLEKKNPWLVGLLLRHGLTKNHIAKNINLHQNEDPAPAVSELTQVLNSLITLIENTIVEDPLNDLTKGNFIKPSVHPQLNQYHHLKTQGQKLLSELEAKEQKQTEISTLKIRFNENMGYFFETRKSQLSKIPTHFIRKQSLINSERFVTEELLELDAQINEAKTNSINLEKTIYEELVTNLKTRISFFQTLAGFIARLDVASTLAELANTKGWCKPELVSDGVLQIKEGRHPVVEASSDKPFIPNDLSIGSEEDTIQIITGPNMSGKSTFLRQNALIIILAHIGSFVPARSAVVPICDQMFTRIGSGDRLFQGESTFLVEMKETAHILKHMSKRSFVIMDEIGRGTSTYDGLALAWTILEYISTHAEKKCKTMFATHYHELMNLNHVAGISHYYVAIKEEKDEIIFLKKVLRGVAGRSYGIEVAKLAGLPQEVVNRAETLLIELEKKSSQGSHDSQGNVSKNVSHKTDKKEEQIIHAFNKLKTKLSDFKLAESTPLEAMNLIAELKKHL